MAPAASTFRWPRLGACLAASIALHFALVLPHLQAVRLEAAPPALLVRIVALTPPELAAKPPQPAAQRERHRENRPMIQSKSPLARPVPVAPVAPPIEPQPPPAARKRAATVEVHEAYSDSEDDLQREVLNENQLRFPRANGLIRPPKPFDPIRPVYSRSLGERNISGSVLLEVFIGQGGAVEEILILDAHANPQLVAAAEAAVRRTSFRPAEGPRGATKSRMTLRIDFRLE